MGKNKRYQAAVRTIGPHVPACVFRLHVWLTAGVLRGAPAKGRVACCSELAKLLLRVEVVIDVSDEHPKDAPTLERPAAVAEILSNRQQEALEREECGGWVRRLSAELVPSSDQ